MMGISETVGTAMNGEKQYKHCGFGDSDARQEAIAVSLPPSCGGGFAADGSLRAVPRFEIGGSQASITRMWMLAGEDAVE